MGATTRHPATTGDGAGLPRVPLTFTPTARARGLLSGLPTMAVLRAPRGFGKSSTVARWLRRADLPDHDVVWVSLPPTPVDATRFWDTVHGAVARAGFSDPGAGPDGWALLARDARERRRHLVLVVDGLDRVRDVGVDEELVALVQQHDGLDLAVLMRGHRPLLALARAALESVVVLRADLALGPAEVGELARAMGAGIGADEAEELARDLGGWPGLIRVALLTAARTARGGLLLDPAGLADYLRVILQDEELAEVAPTLLALAVPAELSSEVITFVVPDGADEVIARARSGGLMPEGDGPPAYPAQLRALLLRILREDHPGRYRDLNRRLAEHHSRSGEPLAALHHASRAQAPRMVLGVLERWWTDLLEHPDPVREALARLPADLLDSSAKARVARDHILPGRVPQGYLVTAATPAWPDPAARTAGSAVSPASAGEPEEAAVLLGLGTARLASGDALGAAAAFHSARTPGRPTTDAEAAGGLALTLALLGHPGPARAQLPAAAAATDGMGAAAVSLVPALLDLDRLGDGSPAPDVAPAGPPHLTALALYVRAGRALHAGAAATITGELARVRESPAGRTGLAGTLLTGALVDLYLATDQVDRARRLVAGDQADPWARAAHARVALALGELSTVLDLTEDAVEQAGLRPRAGLDLALVRAVAAHRLGRYRTAGDALDLATAVAQSSGIVRRLLLVPRPDLDQVARTVPHAAELLARPELAATVLPPAPEGTGRLSRSEMRVLDELAAGRRIAQVARRLYVSESTVKTQVRSIYRKLEVHSRGDALARARELGILDPE